MEIQQMNPFVFQKNDLNLNLNKSLNKNVFFYHDPFPTFDTDLN